MKRKNIILVLMGVLVMCLVVFGITYAFFQSQVGESAQTDINVISNTVDSLVFDVSNSIGFSADQETFGQGMGNASGSTVAKATLTANNKTNTATDYYNLYLNIGYNDFEYSKDNDTPELLLVVKDGDGNAITDIEGLNYVTVLDGKNESVSGYDITTLNGVITLYLNKEIVAEPLKEDSYTIEIVFVNYDFNQALNAGKRFIGDVIITQEVVDYMLGDVNGNGKVDTSDNLILLHYFDGNIALTLNQKLAADANLDGIIDYIDYYIISDFVLNSITYLPYLTNQIYNIIYDLNGGEQNGYLLTRYTTDFKFDLLVHVADEENGVPETTIIKKEGYKFKGWYCEEFSKKISLIPKGTAGDLHLVANWEPIS